jgi:hypothetical protein
VGYEALSACSCTLLTLLLSDSQYDHFHSLSALWNLFPHLAFHTAGPTSDFIKVTQKKKMSFDKISEFIDANQNYYVEKLAEVVAIPRFVDC